MKEEVSLRIDALQEPDDTPPEEKTEEFAAALDHAKVSNLEYLTKLEALESSGRDDESELLKLERELRDRVRETLGLAPRPKRAELNRAEHARSIGIEPNFALGPAKTKPSHSDAALQTLKFPDELDRIMGKLVADARLAEQEMGISPTSRTWVRFRRCPVPAGFRASRWRKVLRSSIACGCAPAPNSGSRMRGGRSWSMAHTRRERASRPGWYASFRC